MKISVRGATVLLAAGAAALALLGLHHAIRGPGGPDAWPSGAVLRLFDLDGEGNVPTWYQSGLLLAGAFLCALMAATSAAATASWRLVAAGLVVMSCDEAAGLHEMAGRWVSAHLDAERLGVYGWLLPGAVVAALVVGLARRAARTLAPGARWLVLLGGLLFFSGAFGVELVELVLDPQFYGTRVFRLVAWVEECLEMAGMIVFLRALMGHLRAHAAAPIAFRD